MNKAHLIAALDRLGLKSTNAGIAVFFGIKEQAVQQWGERIPELRQFHLQRDHPDIYAAARKVARKTQRSA